MILNITGKVLGTVKVHVWSKKFHLILDWHGSDRRLPCLEIDRVWSLQTGSRTGHLNLLSETWWLNVQSGHSKPFWSSVFNFYWATWVSYALRKSEPLKRWGSRSSKVVYADFFLQPSGAKVVQNLHTDDSFFHFCHFFIYTAYTMERS